MPAPEFIELVDAIEEVFTRTLDVLTGLDDDLAARPTGCPGWTVKDQAAHMVGLEQLLAGAPEPDVDVSGLAHVDDEFSALMERPVEARRPLPMISIADEMAGMLPRRMGQYRQLLDEGDAEVTTPFGPRPLSRALPTRLLDLWWHEQDIRMAIGRSPRGEGRSTALVIEQVLRAWTQVLPKRVALDARIRLAVPAAGTAAADILLGEGGPVVMVQLGLDDVVELGGGRSPIASTGSGPEIAGERSVFELARPALVLTP